jgi:hypothetical protein
MVAEYNAEKKYAVLLSRKGRFQRPISGTVLTVTIKQRDYLKFERFWLLGQTKGPLFFEFWGHDAKSISVSLLFQWYDFGNERSRCVYRVPSDAYVLPNGRVKVKNPTYTEAYSAYSRDWSERLARSRKSSGSTFVSSRGSSLRPSTEQSIVQFNAVEGDTCRSIINTPSQYVSYQRSWTGSRTPNFRRLKKKQLPVNPHTVVLFRVQDSLGLTRLSTPVGACGPQTVWSENKTSALYPQVVPAAPSHDAEVLNQAVKRLINRSDLDLQANLAQDLVQIGQTNRLILNAARRIRSAITNVKRGNLPGAAKALWNNQQPVYRKGGGPSQSKNVANNWLELQYGWKPLLQDIHGSMNALAKFNYAGYQVNTVRASAKKVFTDVKPIYHQNFGTRIGSTTVETACTAKIGIRYRLADPYLALLAQTGFTNPLNLAWEVLPYSFVVDWFLPIGPYLESQSAFHGYAMLDGFQTQFTKQKVLSTIYYEGTHPTSAPVMKYLHYGSFTRDIVLLNRIELSKFPSLEFPRIKNGFSVTHILNGLALMRRAFK